MPDAIAMARPGEIQIFALSVRGKSMPTPDDAVVQLLADETGARLYLAIPDKELSAIFSGTEQQMRTQHSISFQPQEPTRGFHTLRLELAGPRNCVLAPGAATTSTHCNSHNIPRQPLA
jgi:hypothetical protein